MLERSHRKLEHHLLLLRQAASRVAAQSTAKGDRELIVEVLQFLERQVDRHERDEEESVFPRLPATAAISRLVSELTSEHQQQRKLVERAAVAWRSRDGARTRGRRLLRIADQLESAYRAHVDREDRRLLPAMREHLTRTQIRDIATEMQSRRGR